ncbi:MAG TPA: hypothetical protein DCL38_10390 [Lachnospiraceae bacterium]|nr:hypothetical protein [Lachnospiraceae bacterium]
MGLEKKLVKLRNEKGLSQKDMAEVLGVHINTYSRVERGISKPGAALVSALARFYGKDEAYFSDEPKAEPGPVKEEEPVKAEEPEKPGKAEDTEEPVKAKEEPALKEAGNEVITEKPSEAEKAPKQKKGSRAGAGSRSKKEKKPAKDRKSGREKVKASEQKEANEQETAGGVSAGADNISIELQYMGKAIPYADIINRAREAAGKSRGGLNIYIKPEENRVYYVAGKNVGSFEI